jgi:DHA1 family tetracycline resistance protein-like MFS transporter
MTQHVSPSQQGQLQGALGALMGIASIVAPPLYTNAFALSIDARNSFAGFPILGTPFFIAAALLGCALIAVLRATAPKRS